MSAKTKTKQTDKPVKAKEMLSAGERYAIRVGAGGAELTRKLLSLAVYMIAATMVYLLAVFVVSSAVPNISMMMLEISGISPDDGLEAKLIFWLLPSLFALALIFALLYAGIRALWRFVGRVSAKIEGFFGGSVKYNEKIKSEVAAAGSAKRKVTS